MRPCNRIAALFASAALLLFLSVAAQAQGTAESLGLDPIDPDTQTQAFGGTSLSPFFNLTGNLTLSSDGTGIIGVAGTIDVAKPAGATVQRAFLFTANVPGGPVVSDGDASLNGVAVTYDEVVNGTLFAPVSVGRSDVTAIVAGVVDPAAAGLVSIPYAEAATGSTDGSVLAVVFDDPAAPTSTVSLLFGVQSPAGDNFSVALAGPFNDGDTDITMSLGISFGFQNGGTGQDSIIEVNGSRLTSSAGGNDDGEDANGALITVGGIGDDVANPADPNAASADPRDDDELYTLDPLIPDGATSINIFSQNPSNDDAVFFAGFQFFGATAIVGEGILLGPVDATNPINTNHTVTARVQDDDGDPVPGRDVDFEILTGPNAGLMGSDVTDAAGEATFTWTSAAAGIDRIVARFVDSNGDTQTSNVARKTWVDAAGECVFSATLLNDSTVPSTGGKFRFRFWIDNSASATDANYTIWGTALGPDGNLFHVRKRSAVNRDPMVPAGAIYSARYNQRADATVPDGTYEYTLHAGTFDPNNPTDTNGCGSETFTLVKGNEAPRPIPDIARTQHKGSVPAIGWEDVEITAGQIIPAALLEIDDATVRVAPNPTRQQTTFAFSLQEDSAVSLTVFDTRGREVAVVADGFFSTGAHAVSLSQSLPAGVYLWRLTAGERTETGHLTVVR